MSKDRERFDKVLALAVSPSAHDGEANAAFQKARDLVKANPSLAHPPPPRAPSTETPSTIRIRITRVRADWILILVGNLSEKAYRLNLKSKINFDFNQQPTAVDLLCEGHPDACAKFGTHSDWLIDYINKKINEKGK